MNLKRNLRVWKHIAIKRSETCAISALKSLNQEMKQDINKYKEMLISKEATAVTDKVEKEAQLLQAIEQKAKQLLKE